MNQLTNAQTTELLRLFAEIMHELKSRGVIRTSNNPVADIGEWVVARAFDLTLAPNSAKGYDALDIQGLRYQIKSRRLTASNQSTQLGVVRDLDANQFDYLLAVYFTEDFEINRVYRIAHAAVAQHSVFSKTQRGYILHMKQAILADSRCMDVTGQCSLSALP